MQETDSIESDQRRIRFRLVIIAFGLILLMVGAWIARPAYWHFKEHREQWQAQKFLANGDYRNAWLSAQQALKLNPTNLPACRVMAEVADLSHSPAALDLLRRIVQTEPTRENQLLLAEAGLRYQNPPFPLTTQILNELSLTATNLVRYQVVAAGLALDTGCVADAEAHFEAAAALEPTNRLFKMNLAVLRLGATNESKASAARQVLEQMETDTNLESAALRALVVDRLAHHDIVAANGYAAQLQSCLRVTLSDKLLQCEILNKLKSNTFAAQLEKLQQSLATNPPAVAQLAAWMQANGFVAGSIVWLTNLPACIRTQSPVRLALADAYVQTADWRSLRDFASQGNWEDADFLRLGMLSYAWEQLNVNAVADSSWSAAITEAGDRYDALTRLLALAEQWKSREKQDDLLERITERFPQERWASQTLVQSYLAAGKTAKMRALYARLSTRFPKDASIKNNLVATDLLLLTNLRQACQWAAELYIGKTNDPVVASTYAYALHIQGRTKDGLALLRQIDNRLMEQPGPALYYGVLLATTGATNEAAPFLQIARKSRLLPEEDRLLAAAMAR